MLSIKKNRPKRSYSGEKWKTNSTNKKYLRIDFNARCAYCDDWDFYNGGQRNYHVEHFAPKKIFPELIHDYSNLLYACPYCNGSKSNKWPSNLATENVVGNKGFLDPCEDDYYNNLYRKEDGSIGYLTELGEYIYRELNLGLKRHQVIYRKTELNEQIKKLKKVIEDKNNKGDNVDDLKILVGKLSTKLFEVGEELQED